MYERLQKHDIWLKPTHLIFELCLMYWNWLRDNICISSNNVDIIYYCIKHFAWTYQTIINLIIIICIVTKKWQCSKTTVSLCEYEQAFKNQS